MSCYCVTSTHISGCINHNKVSVARESGVALLHTRTLTNTHPYTHKQVGGPLYAPHATNSLHLAPLFSSSLSLPSSLHLRHCWVTTEEEPIRLSSARWRWAGWVQQNGGRVGVSIGLWLRRHPCNEFENANGSLHVKVDIVSCDKFSAEVRDNLDANYKQALCHSSVPFTSLISWFPPASISRWEKEGEWRRQTKRQRTQRELSSRAEPQYTKAERSSIINTPAIQPHTKVHKPWLWCRKWARNSIPCVRTSGLISIPGSVSLLMSSLTAN